MHIRYSFGAIAFAAALLLVPAFGAYAQTTSLESQIRALQAQIRGLQEQLVGMVAGPSASGACPYTWTRSLSQGSSGPDVLRLQQFLNTNPATQVAETGAGSPGRETQYYGPLTASAVSRFQVVYRADVLSPLGLVNPTRVFGPSSRAKANMLCATVPPSTDDDDANDDDTDGDLDGGEAFLRNFQISSGADTNLAEGQTAEILEIEFDVDNADARVDRVDVAFAHDQGEEEDPWDTFEEIIVAVNGEEVTQAADDEDEWNDDSPNEGTHTLRVSGIDTIVPEGETAEITVSVTVAQSIDGAENGLSWNVFIPDEGIRSLDSLNVPHYVGDENDTVNIDINEEGFEDELSVRSSSEDPETTTLPVESDTRSDWLTVFAFDLDTGDSENDIEINELPVAFTVSSGTVDTILDDVRLVIDGETFDDVDINDGVTNSMVFSFDNGDLMIDAGDRTTVEVEARFNALDDQYEGVTIRGSASSTHIDAEGADDLEANQLSGSATGETHTLRSQGVTVASDTTETDTQGANDTVGIFRISFDVTAFEDDFYIAENASQATSTDDGGVRFAVEGPSGFGGTASGVLSSTAEESSDGVFVVREGETETFTVSVTVNPTITGLYRVLLDSILFTQDSDGATGVVSQIMRPASDYRTAYQSINAN